MGVGRGGGARYHWALLLGAVFSCFRLRGARLACLPTSRVFGFFRCRCCCCSRRCLDVRVFVAAATAADELLCARCLESNLYIELHRVCVSLSSHFTCFGLGVIDRLDL